jgi:hypothetical protein
VAYTSDALTNEFDTFLRQRERGKVEREKNRTWEGDKDGIVVACSILQAT